MFQFSYYSRETRLVVAVNRKVLHGIMDDIKMEDKGLSVDIELEGVSESTSETTEANTKQDLLNVG